MRITNKDLEAVVRRINTMTNNPIEPYTKGEDGCFHSNVGNYHISGAYGGVSLHQMSNEQGGIRDVFSCGHTTKKDLYNRMQAYINGLLDKNHE